MYVALKISDEAARAYIPPANIKSILAHKVRALGYSTDDVDILQRYYSPLDRETIFSVEGKAKTPTYYIGGI